MTQVDAMRQLDPGLRRDDEREKQNKKKDRKDEKGKFIYDFIVVWGGGIAGDGGVDVRG